MAERQKPKLARVRQMSADGSSKMETVNLNDLKQSQERRHSSLPPDLLERATKLHPRVGYVLQPTLEGWINGFLHDQNPQNEIKVWEHIANVVDYLWIEQPAVLAKLNRRTLTKIVTAVSTGIVDIPSQMRGITDEQVAVIRSVYQGNL